MCSSPKKKRLSLARQPIRSATDFGPPLVRKNPLDIALSRNSGGAEIRSRLQPADSAFKTLGQACSLIKTRCQTTLCAPPPQFTDFNMLNTSLMSELTLSSAIFRLRHEGNRDNAHPVGLADCLVRFDCDCRAGAGAWKQRSFTYLRAISPQH